MARYISKAPLVSWLNGDETLKSFISEERLKVGDDMGNFVALEECIFAHECSEISPQSLESTFKTTDDYINSALKLVFTGHEEVPEDLYVEGEDKRTILSELGEPPKPCLPIYMFTVGDAQNEKIVYIGKTDSSFGRFEGGHYACVKLLDPKYNSLSKRLYLCSVMLLSKDGDYLPLEWVRPYIISAQLLDDIESQLIFHYKPELNSKKKETYCAKNPLLLQLVNYTDKTRFLHEDMVCPPK